MRNYGFHIYMLYIICQEGTAAGSQPVRLSRFQGRATEGGRQLRREDPVRLKGDAEGPRP